MVTATSSISTLLVLVVISLIINVKMTSLLGIQDNATWFRTIALACIISRNGQQTGSPNFSMIGT